MAGGQMYRINRMYLALANDVKVAVEAIFETDLRDVDSVAELPHGGVDVLVVGHQHVTKDGHRHGHEVLGEAIMRSQPKVLVYSMSGLLDHTRHAADIEALRKLSPMIRKYVLETAVLQELSIEEVVRSGRRSLAREMMVSPFGEPEKLVDAEWTNSTGKALGFNPDGDESDYY